MTDDLPWTEKDTFDLFMACVDGDVSKIADWFDKHITTAHREFTIVFALASWCRILAESAGILDGDVLAIPQFAESASPGVVGFGQMVAAAMNNDDTALSAHVAAFMRNPDMQTRMTALTELCCLIHFLGQKAAKKHNPEGTPTE